MQNRAPRSPFPPSQQGSLVCNQNVQLPQISKHQLFRMQDLNNFLHVFKPLSSELSLRVEINILQGPLTQPSCLQYSTLGVSGLGSAWERAWCADTLYIRANLTMTSIPLSPSFPHDVIDALLPSNLEPSSIYRLARKSWSVRCQLRKAGKIRVQKLGVSA